MFRLRHRLAVELEFELGVTGREKIRINILVEGITSVCPRIKISQIARTGTDAGGISPIRPRVTAQPRTGGTMATFAGNTFVRVSRRLQLCGCNGLEWGVTNRAPAAGWGGGKPE